MSPPADVPSGVPFDRPAASPRWLLVLGRVLTVAAVLTAALSIAVWAFGSIRWSLGGLSFTAGRWARPLAVAALLLLLAEGTRLGERLAERLRFVALFAVLVLALVAESTPRLVGDGGEYLAMAWNLSAGRPPALSAEDIHDLTSVYPEPGGAAHLASPLLVGLDGRQDFPHFWLYSACVVPFVWLNRALGASLLTAFTAFNILLYLLTAFVVVRRAGPRVALLLLAGPLVWWVDKAHAEVFVVSLLLLSVAFLESSPRWALVCQGLVAMQNPGLLILPIFSGVWLALRGGMQPRRLLVVVAPAFGLALLAPLYYSHHLGRSSPLTSSILLQVPGRGQLTALLFDTNLGLIVAWPALVAAVVVALVVAFRSDLLRQRSGRLDLAIGVAVMLAVIFVSTLPGNLNHGGTRGVSRYALWLLPLCLPLLGWFDRARAWSRPLLLLLALGSFGSTLAEYHPRQGERYTTPTGVADRLWRHYPRLDDPLPEIFAERVGQREGDDLLPAATEDCEKALLVGDGTEQGAWPLWCEPRAKPDECRVHGRYCYANCAEGDCSFVRAPRQPGFANMRPQSWYWTGSPSPELVEFMRGLPWRNLIRTDAFGARAQLGEVQAIGQTLGLVLPDAFLVWFERPRYYAFVTIPPRPSHEAVLIDPMTGEILTHVRLSTSEAVRVDIPARDPLLLVVVPSFLAEVLHGSPDGVERL